jgi:F-type H+-transporting ATPase subunit f
MNTIIRRAYSTKALIPPNLAATRVSSGSRESASRMGQLVDFYKVRAVDQVLVDSSSSCHLI